MFTKKCSPTFLFAPFQTPRRSSFLFSLHEVYKCMHLMASSVLWKISSPPAALISSPALVRRTPQTGLWDSPACEAASQALPPLLARSSAPTGPWRHPTARICFLFRGCLKFKFLNQFIDNRHFMLFRYC